MRFLESRMAFFMGARTGPAVIFYFVTLKHAGPVCVDRVVSFTAEIHPKALYIASL
jgi:hypothetical protein